MKTKLDTQLCVHLLFLHAIMGCDTTSQLFGIGKVNPLTNLEESVVKAAEVFQNPNSLPEEIVKMGEQCILESI